MNRVGGFLLLFIGLFCGLYLPDVDSRLPFVTHRSAITHSFVLPLLLFVWVRREKQPALSLLSIGLSLSTAIHLCFDLFPRAWRGFALVHVPVYGRLSPVGSWLFIAISLIICLYLTFLLVETLGEASLVLFSMFVVFSFYSTTEMVFWLALIALLLGSSVSLLLPANEKQLFIHLLRSKLNYIAEKRPN